MAEDSLYVVVNGRRLARVMGGSPEGDPPAGDPPADPPAGDPPAPGGSGDPAPEPADDKLGDSGKKALDAERKARAKAEKEAREARAKVEEFENANKSDKEKLEERAAKAEREAQDAAQRALRFEVAAEKGVPLKQAHRLQGSTKEELEKDAEEFLKDVKGEGTPDFDQGPRRPTGDKTNMNDIIRRAAGRA